MKRLLGMLLVFLATVGNARAALIDHGDYFTDTNAGLDWYKLTNTYNLSYNTVTGMQGTGQALDGWVYASRSQIVGLFEDAEIADPVLALGTTFENVGIDGWNKTKSLMDLLGVTYDYGCCSQTFTLSSGMFGTPHSSSIGTVVDGAALILYDPLSFSGAPEYRYGYSIASATGAGGHWRPSDLGGASFLVRATTIPEPSSILLMFAAGLGMVGAMQNRKAVNRQSA